MGHGDEIAIVDANFPAASTAVSTVTGAPILMGGVSAARAVEAVLSVMPLDSFVPDPALRMEVTGDPVAVPPVQQEVQQAVDRAVGRRQPLVGIERFAFYEARERSLRHPRDRRAPSLRLLHLQEGRPAGGVNSLLGSREKLARSAGRGICAALLIQPEPKMPSSAAAKPIAGGTRFRRRRRFELIF